MTISGRLGTTARVGLWLILSTPVSGFITWIVAAVVVGEERLEGEQGMTGAGWLLFALPALVGLGLITTDLLLGPSPAVERLLSPRHRAGLMVAIGLGLVLIGVWSMVGTGSDPNIGGSLLILIGLIALPAAGLAAGQPSGATGRPPADDQRS